MTKMITLFVITILLSIAYQGQAIQCPEVKGYLKDCMTYLRDGGSPPQLCCSSLGGLKAAVHGKADTQAACKCLKVAANKNPEISDDFAKQLPAKCGVSFGIPFSKNVDCDSILIE